MVILVVRGGGLGWGMCGGGGLRVVVGVGVFLDRDIGLVLGEKEGE